MCIVYDRHSRYAGSVAGPLSLFSSLYTFLPFPHPPSVSTLATLFPYLRSKLSSLFPIAISPLYTYLSFTTSFSPLHFSSLSPIPFSFLSSSFRLFFAPLQFPPLFSILSFLHFSPLFLILLYALHIPSPSSKTYKEFSRGKGIEE